MAPRKYTKAQRDSAKKWDAANLDRLSIALPKGKKAEIQAAAGQAGTSVNAYIAEAIEQRLERERAAQQPRSGPQDAQEQEPAPGGADRSAART